MYIWWTNQDDCETLGYVIFHILEAPEYLRKEYDSRLGRAGRGRLWIAKQFGIHGIVWDEEKAAPLGLGDCAGIVIADSELELCLKCPGVVTDLSMNLIRAEEEETDDR